jgi:type IV secretory pathway ATPase VirB11/archaellum biosynthesis ATPase
MKKLILIMLFTVAMFAVKAQTATYQIAPNLTFQNVATDYTLTDAVAQYFVFKAEKNVPIAIDYQVLLTKGTGSQTETTVVLSGRKFSSDTWTDIVTALSGTITTTALVTLTFPGANQYREFKVAFTGEGTGTTTISNQQFKIWYK